MDLAQVANSSLTTGLSFESHPGEPEVACWRSFLPSRQKGERNPRGSYIEAWTETNWRGVFTAWLIFSLSNWNTKLSFLESQETPKTLVTFSSVASEMALIASPSSSSTNSGALLCHFPN